MQRPKNTVPVLEEPIVQWRRQTDTSLLILRGPRCNTRNTNKVQWDTESEVTTVTGQMGEEGADISPGSGKDEFDR